MRCEKFARKKGRAQDNAKINYARIAIQLFSHTIILYLITQENPFVSHLITASTMIQFEMREIYLVKQHKKYKITRTHASHLACFSHFTDVSKIICSRLKSCKIKASTHKHDVHTLHHSHASYNLFFTNAPPFRWDCKHTMHCCYNYMWQTKFSWFFAQPQRDCYAQSGVFLILNLWLLTAHQTSVFKNMALRVHQNCGLLYVHLIFTEN